MQPRCHLQRQDLRGVAAAVAETTRPASTAGHERLRESPTGGRRFTRANSRRGPGVYPRPVIVIANPSTVAPPGACVAVPQVTHTLYVISTGINQHGEIHEAMTRWGFHTMRVADVDGDGILDAFVPSAKPYDCPEDIQRRVFVMRGACGHDVGVIGKGRIAPEKMGAVDGSGYRPLVVTSSSTRGGMSVIPEMTDTTTTYAFSPKLGRYVRRGVKSSTGVCHHCARWSCTPGP